MVKMLPRFIDLHPPILTDRTAPGNRLPVPVSAPYFFKPGAKTSRISSAYAIIVR